VVRRREERVTVRRRAVDRRGVVHHVTWGDDTPTLETACGAQTTWTDRAFISRAIDMSQAPSVSDVSCMACVAAEAQS
jgi:hypothetical protein